MVFSRQSSLKNLMTHMHEEQKKESSGRSALSNTSRKSKTSRRSKTPPRRSRTPPRRSTTPPPPSLERITSGHMKQYYDHVTKDSLSALHYFCRSGNCCHNKSVRRDIKTMIDRHPEVISQRTPNGGDTPLHFAAATDDLKTVKLLLKYNPSAAMIKSNEEGYFGNQMTALHVAIASRASLEMIEVLVRASPKSVRVRDGRGRSVQDLALKYYSDDGYTVSMCMEKFFSNSYLLQRD